MHLTFWWDNGDIEEWDSTFLSFHDGIVMQGGRLSLSRIEKSGVVFTPRYVNKSAHKKDLIEPEIVLVPPEDVPHLMRLDRSGWPALIADGEGGFVNLILQEATAGKGLEQIEPEYLTPAYDFNSDTGEILENDDAGAYRADAITALIDEAFEALIENGTGTKQQLV